ncbi:MAG: peroxiredoxin [Pseudomonadota bacterium]
MTLEVGARLPDAEFIEMGANGPETVTLSDLSKDRRIVLFALPGAFTSTCTAAHLPSFMRTEADFRDKGVQDIFCLSVNDPFVMGAWAESTGASKSGIRMICDPGAIFTKAVEMDFTVPSIGLYNRSNRYAVVIDDGEIIAANIDEPNVCDVSTGEKLLEQL